MFHSVFYFRVDWGGAQRRNCLWYILKYHIIEKGRIDINRANFPETLLCMHRGVKQENTDISSKQSFQNEPKKKWAGQSINTTHMKSTTSVIIGILVLIIILTVINKADTRVSNLKYEVMTDLAAEFQELGYATCLNKNVLVNLVNLQASIIGLGEENITRTDCETSWSLIGKDSYLESKYNPNGDRSP